MRNKVLGVIAFVAISALCYHLLFRLLVAAFTPTFPSWEMLR